jgi:hypothetical protein
MSDNEERNDESAATSGSELEPIVIQHPKPSTEEFRVRFSGEIAELLPQNWTPSQRGSQARDAYFEFLESVGNTTDGSPEEEARFFYYSGGV